MKKWTLLFIILAIAFVLDVFIPDPLPLVDEIILALALSITGYKASAA